MSSTAIVEKWNGSQNAVTDPKIIDIKSLANEIEKFVSDASNFELANSNQIKKKSSLQNLSKFKNLSEQNKFVADQTTFEIVKHLAPCDPGVENLHAENVNYSLSLQSSEDNSLKENLNITVKTFGTSYKKMSNDDQNHDANINLINSNNLPIVKDLSKYDQVVENECDTNCSEKIDTVTKEKHNNILEKCYLPEKNTIKSCEFFKYPLTIIEKSEQKKKPKKSVKEIIDSINRSQQLLKESAQKSAISVCAESACADPICHNQEIHEITSNNLKIDNNLFARHDNIMKHKISKQIFPYRESSPTASNLDWNPLPKPKRINSGSNL